MVTDFVASCPLLHTLFYMRHDPSFQPFGSDNSLQVFSEVLVGGEQHLGLELQCALFFLCFPMLLVSNSLSLVDLFPSCIRFNRPQLSISKNIEESSDV